MGKKPVIVPYSKGNEDGKQKIVQAVFLTIGPVPLIMVASTISQLEKEGWVVKASLFMGMQQTNPGIMMQRNEATPVYSIIVSKMLLEGQEIKEPEIKFN